MKTIRNCKINRICYKLYSKYRKNVISLVTAAVLLFTSLPLSEASSVVAKMVSKLSNAITAMAEDTPSYTDISDKINNGVYTVNTASDLVNLFKANPSVYKDITIKFATTEPLTANAIQGITKGLGNESNPFSGKVEATDGSPVNIPLDVALFEYLDDSADLCEITLRRPTNDVDNALLAEHVTHSDTTKSAKGWNVIKATTSDDDSKAVNYSFTSVIGEMAENSIVGLTITCGEDTVVANTSGNAGLACGTMGKGAQLAVNTTASNFSVAATSGNAGSLVGEMDSGTKLIIDKDYSFTGEVTGANAGGIVGSSTDGALEIADGGSVSVTGTVTASADNGAAGGMFGCYTYNIANDEAFMYKFDLTKWKDVKATVGSAGADGKVLTGGFFGTLVNNSSNKICINSDMSVQYEPVYSDVVRASSFGGLIGKYSASSLTASLEINAVNMNLQQISNVYDFGGLIGSVKENTQAYIKIDTAKITVASSSTTNNNGGLIGFIYHSFVDVCGSTTIVNKSASAKYVGGLVSRFVVNGSVLRLSGTTDLTNAYPKDPGSYKCQIVGDRGDALVYAVGNGNDSGWKLIRNDQTDLEIDDMNWGEVLRLDGTNLTESENLNQSRKTDVLYFDSSAHTVTIKGFDDKNNVLISNEADFARAALIMQQSVLNPFIKIGGKVNRSDMLSAIINIQKDIDLSGTGITGFTRDTSGNVFSGTLNGNSYKITLAVGEPYGTFSGEEGKSKGQIVYHNYNGLFASTNGAEISDLTIVADFSNVVGKTEATKIGALSAFAQNGLTVKNVTATTTASISTNQNLIIGGLVGFVEKSATDNKDISFENCNVNVDLTYKGTNDNTYLGGVIGAVEYASAERKISFDDVTVKGSINQESTSVTNARVGGLIAEIRADDSASGTYNEVSISDVNINGLDIDTKATSTSGGFFGHNWYRTNVTLDSATVSNSTLKTACTEFGGLVTATTGYWNISKLTFGEGIEISGSKANAFGMLIDSTFGRRDDPYGSATKETCELDGSYIEFITPDGYKINSATTISLGNNARFDEIAAYGIHSGAFSESDSNGQSIISLPADDNGTRTVIMDGENCNTYQNQTTNNGSAWAGNSLSRYYYNLDQYKDNPSDDAQQLLIWSVHQFAADNIKKYFKQTDFPTGIDFDLEGYSYYPVDADSVEISSAATFKFYNTEIEKAEALNSGDNLDTLIRKTTGSDDSHTQHYMMHHGLFRNITNLTVSGKVTLSGSIGKTDNGSGALVCGTVQQAQNSQGIFSVSSTGSIKLNGIYVNGDIKASGSYAPLLVNMIGANTDISIVNVSASAYDKKSDYNLPNGISYAATSLIGKVGDSTATGIFVNFSGIKLAANKNNSLFSNATLMEYFMYQDSCSGTYNFTWDDNWKNDQHNVTYGAEIDASEKNPGKQVHYYNDWENNKHYIDPEKEVAASVYEFSKNGYLPYVAETSVTGEYGNTYHEIDVNVWRPNLLEGCGTYSDPYVIDSGELLETIANAIASGSNISDNWKVNYNPNVDVNNATVNAESAFCNGGDTTKHNQYVFNMTSKKFECSGQTDVGTDDFRQYLCEAYYVIDKNIDLNENYVGLGYSENRFVFRGVILGKKDTDGNYPTITNESAVSLIRFSNGSVVKDLVINNNKNISLSKEKTDNKYTQINYLTPSSEVYGGVIAVVFGGDNIIDNVSVTHPSSITLTGVGSHLIPAGGYIGAIVYGGVIFRNMKNVAENSALTIAEAGVDKYTNLFVNPYIGRVVNGFAIEEGSKFQGSQTLKNGSKNYVITEFDSDLEDNEKLTVGNAYSPTIEVPNAQSLFMLSIISQSGMGYTNNYENTCGYGWYTFTRSADYTNVGSEKLNNDYTKAVSDYQRVELKKDTVYNNKISVMLQKYTKKVQNDGDKNYYYEAKWSYDSRKYTVNLTGTDYNLTDTGFRGINQLFTVEGKNIGDLQCNYSLTLSQINGSSKKITLDMDIKAYVLNAADNNVTNGNASEYDNYTYKIVATSGRSSVTGIGFINSMNTALTVDSLSLAGSVSIKSYDNNSKAYANEDISTGGIIGANLQNCTFKNVTFDGLDVHGAYTSGGLIGKAWGDITIENLQSDGNGISVYGGFETGGLVGSVQQRKTLKVSSSNLKIGIVQLDNGLTVANTSGINTWFGVGGIAGATTGNVTISEVTVVPSSSSSFIGSTSSENTAEATQTMNVGGLIGLTLGSSYSCTIDDTKVGVSVHGRNSGGFIGHSNSEVSITNGNYGKIREGDTAPSVNGYWAAGGFVGYQRSNVTISQSVVSNASINISVKSNYDTGVGGYVGRRDSGDLVLKDIEATDLSILAVDQSKTPYIGSIVGLVIGGETTAYDVLINKVSYGDRTSTNKNVADIIGDNGNQVAKFVGVSVNNDKYFGDANKSNNFTAIHTDYKGDQENKTAGFDTASKGHVDTASPYVNVNPAKTYDNLTLTGDFIAGNMSDVIAAARSNSSSTKKYQNTGVNDRADKIDQTKLTIFSKASDVANETANDMPILLIDDNSSANITTMLSDYVSVLTNHETVFSEDQSSLVNVSVQSYKYDTDNWTKTDKSSLTYDNTKHRFKTQNGVYDNDGTARFTLITLDYKDPTGSDKTALRIHVPVFVKKVLDFSFTSRVLTGTNYDRSAYKDSTFAFESFGSPITTYFTYTYYRTADEWADAINNGDDLLWKFDKKLKLLAEDVESGGVLPAGTKLTLVDVNQSDKAYQKTANEGVFDNTTGVLDLSAFGDDLITLNDLLMKYATVTADVDNTNGTLVKLDDSTGATAMATLDGESVYFRPASNDELEDASVAKYSVSVTNKDKDNVDTSDRIKLSENYYLTIQTPATTDNSLIKNFVGYSSTTDKKLDCPKDKSLPTNELYSNKATYIIANFLTQKVTVNPQNTEEINTSNDFIKVIMTSTITLNPDLANTFRPYVQNIDFEMYQGFNISLTKFIGSVSSATQIVGGSTVEGEFSIGETKSPIDSFTLTEAKDNLFLQYPKSIWDNLKENNNVTISADVKITYSTAGMIEQFPERKDGDKTTGIAVNASSNIAYSEDSVEHSQVSVTARTEQHYYRRAMTAADLSYNAVESAVIEAKDSPFSQLGVNPNDMSSEQMLITAKGHYDLTELTENIRNQGKQIKFTMTLLKKNAQDDYEQVDDIDNYLNGIKLTDEDDKEVTAVKVNDTYTFTIDYNKNNTYDVTTKFNVITGKAFEDKGQTYANYKVQLTAELLDKDRNPIAGTTVSDYIIYTNARINTSFISAS